MRASDRFSDPVSGGLAGSVSAFRKFAKAAVSLAAALSATFDVAVVFSREAPPTENARATPGANAPAAGFWTEKDENWVTSLYSTIVSACLMQGRGQFNKLKKRFKNKGIFPALDLKTRFSRQ